jgi:hypothetical protein
MILYTAADLLWATRIKAAADDLGLPARPVRTVEMLRDRLGDTEPSGLIVDLDAEPAIEIIGVADEARRRTGRPARILAFGPHADVARLRAASEAGADQALPRGTVAGRLDQVLRTLAGVG